MVGVRWGTCEGHGLLKGVWLLVLIGWVLVLASQSAALGEHDGDLITVHVTIGQGALASTASVLALMVMVLVIIRRWPSGMDRSWVAPYLRSVKAEVLKGRPMRVPRARRPGSGRQGKKAGLARRERAIRNLARLEPEG